MPKNRKLQQLQYPKRNLAQQRSQLLSAIPITSVTLGSIVSSVTPTHAVDPSLEFLQSNVALAATKMF
tara:strand:- start:295 stop:498 length:204 start_codon:yes stop_codon:yes gene_type:complete